MERRPDASFDHDDPMLPSAPCAEPTLLERLTVLLLLATFFGVAWASTWWE